MRVLRIDRPDGRRVLKFDGLSGRGLRIALAGDEYEVSVTGLAFCVIRYKKHYFDQPPPVAFPLWCLTAPPSPRSSVGRQKENALMGRLGALLRPTWRSYAGPPQGTIKLRYAVSCL